MSDTRLLEDIRKYTSLPSALPFDSDYFEIPSYDVNNNPLKIVYKKGGPNGDITATLLLTYSGTNLSTYTLEK